MPRGRPKGCKDKVKRVRRFYRAPAKTPEPVLPREQQQTVNNVPETQSGVTPQA